MTRKKLKLKRNSVIFVMLMKFLQMMKCVGSLIKARILLMLRNRPNKIKIRSVEVASIHSKVVLVADLVEAVEKRDVVVVVILSILISDHVTIM